MNEKDKKKLEIAVKANNIAKDYIKQMDDTNYYKPKKDMTESEVINFLSDYVSIFLKSIGIKGGETLEGIGIKYPELWEKIEPTL